MKAALTPTLPYVVDCAGVGGMLKVQPGHFCVTELPEESSPQADGKHAFVTLTREGQTTKDVQARLAKLFGVDVNEIGAAGLKDRHARVTQTFSLPRERLPKSMRRGEDRAGLAEIAQALRAAEIEQGWTVEAEPEWHRTKLKKGVLRGNRFDIIVSDTALSPADALLRSREIANALRSEGGFANYYGPQRFGHGGSTAYRGRDLLLDRFGVAPTTPPDADADNSEGGPPRKKARWRRKRRAPWLDSLAMNAFQSALFNLCVAERIQRGLFGTLLCGDLVCFHSSPHKPRMVKPPGVWNAPARAAVGAIDGATTSAAADDKAIQHASKEDAGSFDAKSGALSAETSGAEGATATSALSSVRVDWDAVDFSVPPSEEDLAAFRAGQLAFTGPIFGGGMALPRGVMADIEQEIWALHMPAECGDANRIKPAILAGTRRLARLPVPDDLSIDTHDECRGLRFRFTLPAGSYATNLLREFMRNDGEADKSSSLGVGSFEDDRIDTDALQVDGD